MTGDVDVLSLFSLWVLTTLHVSNATAEMLHEAVQVCCIAFGMLRACQMTLHGTGTSAFSNSLGLAK